MLVTALISNGQTIQVLPMHWPDQVARLRPPYAKVYFGEPTPFDTAVAVRIDRYRVEGLKLRLGQQLVDSLISEIKGLTWEIKLADSIHLVDESTIRILALANARKDEANHDLKTEFDRLYGVIQDQNKWYKRPQVYLGAFVVVELLRLLKSN